MLLAFFCIYRTCGCTCEVRRALEKLELISAAPRGNLNYASLVICTLSMNQLGKSFSVGVEENNNRVAFF